MVIQSNCKFAKNINAPTVSKVFPNAEGDILAVQVSGDFSSGIVHIEGRSDPSGDWVSLAGVSLGDLAIARGGITKPGMYEIGVVGVREIRANIESVSGGKMSVFGQIISTEET